MSAAAASLLLVPLLAGPTGPFAAEPDGLHAGGGGADGRTHDLLEPDEPDEPASPVCPEDLILRDAPETDASPTHRDAPQAPSLVWPVRGTITSGYGPRHRTHFHAGIDIATTPGTIIVAAAPGRVVLAGRAAGGWGRYGNVVLLEHVTGWRTLYAHASRLYVREGQTVRQGQAIAAVGRTGNATGPHLHLEVWSGEHTIDPLALLAGSGRTAQLVR